MSGAAAPAEPLPRGGGPGAAAGPRREGGGFLATALVSFVVAGTLAAVLSGAGPGLAVLPVAIAGAIWLVARVPLRRSAALLLLLLLAVDDTRESRGQWRTPFALVGDLLHLQINTVLPATGIPFAGMELVCLLLLVVWARRRSRGLTIDTRGQTPVPSLLRGLLILYVATVVLAQVYGLLQGQALVPWKIRNLLHPLLLFLVFHAAFRGTPDHATVGRAVVFAAVVRAVEAFVVQRLAVAATGGKFATATSHGDSILFSVAAFLLIVDALERPDPRRYRGLLLLLPVLLVGMMENGRRLVWVMLAMQLLVAFVLSPMKGWKKPILRSLLIAAPALVLYVGVGWNRSGPVFAPIRTLRSVADTSVDRSAYWREVENWNIAMTIRDRPLLGSGLGAGYVEYMKNDDISNIFAEYREWPHNTVLGQLMLLGLVGFVATWSLFAVALFLCVRSYWMATNGRQRVAALGCAGAIVACHLLAYGDTGAHYPQYKIFMALALALGGKLAIETGAWPRGRRPRALPQPREPERVSG
jgi:O-antigen ligase